MKITIRKPIGYSHIGRKDQQEDAVWPLFPEATAENTCIVLCDGVGGSEHGEIASQNASRVIGEYLTERIARQQTVSEADVQQAVNLAYDELEKLDTDNAEGQRVTMATTLTCVCLHADGVLAAHMGDSRIYQVRPGQGLLYQSADHSLVSALLQAGELTPEEAKNFPRKNVITKAIQPHAGRRFKAEVHQLIDVRSGDYLFLCCDGVLEQLTNERLVEILSMDVSDAEKLRLLEAESTDRTKDNYTAYLIPVNEVEGASSLVHDDEVEIVGVAQEPKPATENTKANQVPKVEISQNKSETAEMKRGKVGLKIFIGILLVLIVLGLCFVFFKPSKSVIPAQLVEISSPSNSGSASGHDYVDLGLSVKWSTCNVGSSSPEGRGDYYAWGETLR